MIKVYTIGFTKKTAEEFFNLLELNNIKVVLDVRLNNVSQLAGFTKGNDLKYFLYKILTVEYLHNTQFSPTKEILMDYKNKVITWGEYEKEFNMLLRKRKLETYIREYLIDKLDSICILCSESEPTFCHRRLVAEYIKEILTGEDIEIIHI
ncbi:DUF488 family protein [Inconstantimicrobium mannanitabidum]|uniref:Uncharacterized protein n=1 Tax=Inconstantimicrobium mannanitabidum TaxID=1604901 RepID=A0ACB5RCQ1_9CLOT|nr:DUF488 domain-containing protein [Clostridium sp. TW13]GKX66881.1 hypothetical protein rsdtw13_21390 [Clostridium sp. TW13]